MTNEDTQYLNVDYEGLSKLLLTESTPLAERFRALFSLKAVKDDRSVDIIAKGFEGDSALLKHELAYCLGQMKNTRAMPVLEKVLRDMNEDPMVRHEAAEAMGAISTADAIPILEEFLNDPSIEVVETCQIALDKIKHDQEAKDTKSNSIYTSIDPAPPAFEDKSTPELKDILLNPELPLFKRYRAMFALRNRGDEESVLALAEGLEDSSALFRHEIAFVFGQMQHKASIPALIKSLSKLDEAAMVRHESAEALGSIAHPDVLPILKQFSKDEERVVRESCLVALDMYEYENSDQFQYASLAPSTAN